MNPHKRHNSAGWIDAGYWLGWLALVCSLLYLVGSYGSYALDYRIIHSSDAMFIPVFFRDLLARGTMAGWDLPTNPYFFPDMLLFIPLDLIATQLFGNIYLAIIFYGVAQLLLTVVAMLLLQRYLFGAERMAQTLTLLASTLCLLFIASWRHIFELYAFVSVHHYGVFLVIPLATLALLAALRQRQRSMTQRWAALLLYLLVQIGRAHV